MDDRRANPTAIPRVAVLGCGRIGSSLDEGAPGSTLTHASAWQTCTRAQLVALADPHAGRLQQAGAVRNISSLYRDPFELLEKERPDIVSVATPTQIRLDVVRAALACGAKVILLEKPIADSVAEGEEIARAVRESGAVVAANYLRRWDPILTDLAARVRAGAFGRTQHVVATYGKGILTNGTHMLDLFRMFFGEARSVRVMGRRADDGTDADPTLDALFTFGPNEVPVFLIGSDHRHYSIFEFDLIADGGRLRMLDSGFDLVEQLPEPDPVFPGYQRLGAPSRVRTELDRAMLAAVDEMVDIWRGSGRQPRCGIADGLAALRLVEASLRSHALDQTIQIETEAPLS